MIFTMNMQPTSDEQAVALVSLGCPKNLVDSEKMLAHLAEAGYVVGASLEEADIVVINTCGFLSSARDESLEVIQEALQLKEQGKLSKVIVAGCLVQRDAEKLYELAPGIDGVLGVNDRDEIVQVVAGKTRTLVHPFSGAIHSDAGRFRLTAPHTAFLRISEGCSHRCTFCTIPDIRGPFRSKPMDAVLQEAKELIADGALELNVIAQDTTSYGTDLPGDITLAGLLRELDNLEGVRWIRLMYTYPRRFTDELIQAMTDCQHVVPYVDMPLQHISDTVLRRMGRRVSRQEVEVLLGKLRAAGIAVRTTFIVGFPGETDAEFQELLDFTRDFRFDAMGVFEYSPEPETPAAKLPNPVPQEVKAERYNTLMAAQQEIAFSANEAMTGREVEILVDGIDTEGYCIGRHAGQAPEIDSICYVTDPQDEGTFLRARVVGSDEYDLIVEPL